MGCVPPPCASRVGSRSLATGFVVAALSVDQAACDFEVPNSLGVGDRCRAYADDFYEQAERDFAPFHGLSAWDAQRARNVCRAQGAACFLVQISDGQVYVSEEQSGFQSRNRLTMAFLQRVASKLGPLPDAEFVVDTSDGYMNIEAPVFVIAKFPTSVGGILYPDFSSFAWPESECPAEQLGAHVWHRVIASLEVLPSWDAKSDTLFWRGAATSVYRRDILPHVAALPDANVSFIEWAVSREGRQNVSYGTCVPLAEWCIHRYLANLPGNTMALSLKYRLLCGSVVVSPPFWYHEWFYSQLRPGVHYVEVDPAWVAAKEVLTMLRTQDGPAKAIASIARDWARRHLSEDAMDCYWRRLIELAHAHFPPPRVGSSAAPLELAMLGLSGPAYRPDSSISAVWNKTSSAASASLQPQKSAVPLGASSPNFARSAVDVAVVIPVRAEDAALMHRARSTWLGEGSPVLGHRHFFIISSEDPGVANAAHADDVLVVDCPHGYTWLLRKMALAYRALLAAFDIRYFLRTDVDNVLPLPLFLPLLLLAARKEAVVRVQDGSVPCASPPRWRKASVGALVCQTECATDRGCTHFAVDDIGGCETFSECGVAARGNSGDIHTYVYEYRLRAALRERPLSSSEEPLRGSARGGDIAFVLGTILYGNRVLTGDVHNPQWNNAAYLQDLGVDAYPPYPEASGYAMSAAVAAFLAGVGEEGGALAPLAWKSWAIEDAAMGTALAGLNVSLLQLPVEVRDRMRVVRVARPPEPNRSSASGV